MLEVTSCVEGRKIPQLSSIIEKQVSWTYLGLHPDCNLQSRCFICLSSVHACVCICVCTRTVFVLCIHVHVCIIFVFQIRKWVKRKHTMPGKKIRYVYHLNTACTQCLVHCMATRMAAHDHFDYSFNVTLQWTAVVRALCLFTFQLHHACSWLPVSS